MKIYTIGFTKKSAEQFFEKLKSNGIKKLIDVRLNNSSQLAAFAKKDDLRYFLKKLCDAEYVHMPIFAPEQTMLDEYRDNRKTWETYQKRYLALMKSRKVETEVSKSELNNSVLLCSEVDAEHCHRKLVIDYLEQHWGKIHAHHL